MPRLDRIYTKTGDEGMTGLGGGQRVAKDSLAGRDLRHGRRAQLADRGRARDGAVRAPHDASSPPSRTSCSTSGRTSRRRPPARPATRSRPSRQRHIEKLERLIDEFNEVVGPLTNFLLPGGSPGAAQLHVARTVCRRAERERHHPRPRRGDRPDRAPLPQPPVRRAVRDGALREPRARRRRTAVESLGSDVASCRRSPDWFVGSPSTPRRRSGTSSRPRRRHDRREAGRRAPSQDGRAGLGSERPGSDEPAGRGPSTNPDAAPEILGGADRPLRPASRTTVTRRFEISPSRYASPRTMPQLVSGRPSTCDRVVAVGRQGDGESEVEPGPSVDRAADRARDR